MTLIPIAAGIYFIAIAKYVGAFQERISGRILRFLLPARQTRQHPRSIELPSAFLRVFNVWMMRILGVVFIVIGLGVFLETIGVLK